MKILPIKPLSQMYKAKNLIHIIEQNSNRQKQLPDYDRKVELIGKEYTVREVRSLYKFIKMQADKLLKK